MQLKNIIDRLLAVETADTYPIRRDLEKLYHDQLKSGDALKVTYQFDLECIECNDQFDTIDAYYYHLIVAHSYNPQQAEEVAAKPEQEFETDMQQLQTLLVKYTDAQIEVVRAQAHL